jgi:Rad3-related DNA helicase
MIHWLSQEFGAFPSPLLITGPNIGYTDVHKVCWHSSGIVSVLSQICAAFNSSYKYIILEAPTGFGKSSVAIAVAMTLGSSYICTSTKDLQTQYSRDFPYLKVAKGKNNFPCLVKKRL